MADPSFRSCTSREPAQLINLNLQEWKFNRTLSYWIGVFFTKSNLLFLFIPVCKLHGFTIHKKEVEEEFRYALSKFPVLCASTLFLLGCYIGYLEMINMDDGEIRRWFYPSTRLKLPASSIVGWTAYFIGALFQQLNAFSELFEDTPKRLALWELSDSLDALLVSWPAFFSGVFFFIGGICEVIHNECFSCLPVTAAWWASVMNCLGGFGFFILGFLALLKPDNELPGILINLISVILYLIASVLFIWMWRGEHFGLALLSVLNDAHANYGRERRTSSFGRILAQHGAQREDIVVDNNGRNLNLSFSDDGRPEIAHDPGPSEFPLAIRHSDACQDRVVVRRDVLDQLDVHPRLTLWALLCVFLWVMVGAAQTLEVAALTRITKPPMPQDPYSEKFWRHVQGNISHTIILVIVDCVLVYQSAALEMPRERPYKQLAIMLRILVFPMLLVSTLEIFGLFMESADTVPEPKLGSPQTAVQNHHLYI